MAATERFSTLDTTLQIIKEEHNHELQGAMDALLAAKLETDLYRAQAAEAKRERDTYMRLATKLVAQFSTVEQVFSTAKQLALDYAMSEKEVGDSSRGGEGPPKQELPAEGAPAESPPLTAEAHPTREEELPADAKRDEAEPCPPTPEEIAAKVAQRLENPQ